MREVAKEEIEKNGKAKPRCIINVPFLLLSLELTTTYVKLDPDLVY